MNDYIRFVTPEEPTMRQYDPKKHIMSLLNQAKSILDKVVEEAEKTEDIEEICGKTIFELFNIFFYLGLLGSNIKLHLASKEIEKEAQEIDPDRVVKRKDATCRMCRMYREDLIERDLVSGTFSGCYNCSTVGHTVKADTRVCREFDSRPDIEVIG